MFENNEMIIGKESMVKIASVQTDLVLGDVKGNVEKGIARIKEAADNGAKLIVLTELSTSGYAFNNRAEALAVSEEVPSGDTVSRWETVAAEKDVYIVAGISEKDGNKLYNTSVLVGPEGYIGKYRKLHIWDREKLWYEPGDLGTPVFKTPIGRIAMMICYDVWFQELWRIYGALGADIVCCPVNWVKIDVLPDDMLTFGPHNVMVGCYDNGVCAAVADRVGEERGLIYPGMSMILSPLGIPVDGPASRTDEEIKYAELNLSDSRRLHWAEFAGARLDRRTDVYDVLCGAEGKAMPF